MACNGHTNSCPVHPGYDPPLSPVSWSNIGLGTDVKITELHFNALRYYINIELDRRSTGGPTGWPPSNKDTNDVIYASDYRMLRDGLVNCKAWSPSWSTDAYLVSGGDILDESTNEMRDRVGTLRAECLCNCNYSCTCQCNYCTCNCNYSCTCDCNY